jgi:hypothetical protein
MLHLHIPNPVPIRAFNIIVSIDFQNPIVHILQTPSLYQKRIETRVNRKNIRYLYSHSQL